MLDLCNVGALGGAFCYNEGGVSGVKSESCSNKISPESQPTRLLLE
jgi:hypothetical protein